MQSIPNIVLQLIDKFREHAESYRSDEYKEAQCRVDFIDPLFKALGWDMDNTAAYAAAYRDVIYQESEASVRTGHERATLRRQIAVLDRQIDQLVYELYGLTDEEIRIVEEATP